MKTLIRQIFCSLALLMVTGPALAAQEAITGRVTSAETLAPLNGVLVSVADGNAAVLTNANGTYTITAPGTATLDFSLLGYAQESVAVDNRTVVNVEMSVTALALDEVIAVGYATQTRATVSGAVSSVSSEDLNATSESTIADMLVGKVAGINTRMITTTSNNNFQGREPRDGRPGSASVLQIRNMGEPLFVIDGVPQTALEFNQLNATDIENISILKDASASVYGFRAANGVVLVTTKRGSTLRTPQININGTYGVQNLARSRSPFGYGNTAYQFKYSIIESQQNRGEDRTISPEEMEQWRQAGPGFENYEPWTYVINNENAMQGNINASISGGADRAQYYLSVGHITQDYVMEDNNFNRSNFQANLQTELFGGFSVGTELRGRIENHITTAITNTSSPTSVGDPMTVYFQAIQSTWPHQNPYANGNPEYINGDVRYFIRSPVAFNRENSGTQDQVRRNFTGNFWAQYELPIGPVVKGTFSTTSDLEEFDVHRYTFDGYKYDPATDSYNVFTTYNDASRRHIRGVTEGSFANLTLTHNQTFGEHTLSGVAGFEMSSREGTETRLFSVPPTNFNPLIDFVDVRSAETDWQVQRRASYLGRLNYDYKQKYLVEALGRYDGSYLYAPDNRWGFFPGVSLGWRITEEPFFQNLAPFFDELKFRASWGQAGREEAPNDDPWAYLGGASYGQGNPAVLDGQVTTGIQPRGLPVTNLSWVTSTMRNIGFDFAVLDRKLAGEIDLFERKLSGIPAARYDVVIPGEVGYSLPEENLESEANIGIDAIIRYNDRIGAVGYTIAPNFTLARQKVLDRYKPRYENSWDEYRTAEENRWDGINFNYHAIGQFQTMEEIARYPVNIDGQGNRTLLPGDLIFEDVNNDGLITNLDQRPRGFAQAATPILSFGLNGSLDWAGFNLNYSFAGGGLFSFSPGSDLRIPYTSDHNGGAYIWSRWRRADPYDDNSEWIPGKFPPLRKAQNNHSSYRNSDFTYTNVKFLRLRNVELGYTIPAEFASRLSLANLRVYTSAANPWLLDNAYKWAMDPEVGQCCAQIYPTPTVYNVGFSASIGGAPRMDVAVPVPPAADD